MNQVYKLDRSRFAKGANPKIQKGPEALERGQYLMRWREHNKNIGQYAKH